MKPVELAENLRKIASKIDASKSPRKDLVVGDLKKIVAAIAADTEEPEEPAEEGPAEEVEEKTDSEESYLYCAYKADGEVEVKGLHNGELPEDFEEVTPGFYESENGFLVKLHGLQDVEVPAAKG